MALKPIISGYDSDDSGNDSALILKSHGIAPTEAAMEAISPWRFAAPLSPNIAASKEGKPQVDLDKLVAFCRGGEGDYKLVEGIGGVMTPINDDHTVLDLTVAPRLAGNFSNWELFGVDQPCAHGLGSVVKTSGIAGKSAL